MAVSRFSLELIAAQVGASGFSSALLLKRRTRGVRAASLSHFSMPWRTEDAWASEHDQPVKPVEASCVTLLYQARHMMQPQRAGALPICERAICCGCGSLVVEMVAVVVPVVV